MNEAVSRPLPGFIDGAKPVMKGVLLEAYRRNEFYSVFIIAGLFIVASIVVQLIGVENPATGTFILNLGMTYAYYASNIIVAVLIIKQVPADIENRTVYPILAKPINRFNYLFGKWSAVTITGIAIYLVLTFFVWIASPRMESYDALLLLQNVILQCISIAALAGMGLFLSLLAPIPVALIVSGLIFVFGTKFINLLMAQFRGSSVEDLLRWVLNYLPNFDRLNLITRYTDGIERLDILTFAGLSFYGILITVVMILLSAAVFSRRPL